MKKLFPLSVLFLYLPGFLQAQWFYDQGTIQKIEISFSQSNWDYILDTAKVGADTYTMAQWVKINGTYFDSTGVKYKGNSSYNPKNTKNPLHIELDHFKQQDYQGYKDIKLSNGFNEPAVIREALTYALLQPYADAPVANFAQVYINGKYFGLYTNVEAITRTFVKDRFYSDDNTFVFADFGGCDLRYKGTDTTLYYAPYTMKSLYGWTDLMNLCKTLRWNVAGIENILDVDRSFWMQSLSNAMIILDSYHGSSKHNYYLYEDDNGRFNPIIWDLNGAFGIYAKPEPNITLNVAQMQTLTPLLHYNDTMWPLINRLMTVPMYQHMYIAHLRTVINENFMDSSYYYKGLYLQGVADTAYQSDQNKFFSYAQFLANLTTDVTIGTKTYPGITSLMEARAAFLQATAEFQQPPPLITSITPSDTFPLLNSNVYITAAVSNAATVWVGSRYSKKKPFVKVQMFDDGTHGDGSAGDGVYGASLPVTNTEIQYFIYADNANAGMFAPERAEHEFFTLRADNSFAESTGVHVYPNPFSSNVTFRMPYDNCSLRVYDVLGNLVAEEVLETKRETLRLSLAAGMYFYRAESEGSVIGTGKLVTREE